MTGQFDEIVIDEYPDDADDTGVDQGCDMMSRENFTDCSGVEYARLVRAILLETVQDLQHIIGRRKLDQFVDDTGRNMLHIAALHECTKSIAPLVEAGADPNQISADGMTPLDVAADHDPKLYDRMIKIVRISTQGKDKIRSVKTSPEFKKRPVRLYGDEMQN